MSLFESVHCGRCGHIIANGSVSKIQAEHSVAVPQTGTAQRFLTYTQVTTKWLCDDCYKKVMAFIENIEKEKKDDITGENPGIRLGSGNSWNAKPDELLGEE